VNRSHVLFSPTIRAIPNKTNLNPYDRIGFLGGQGFGNVSMAYSCQVSRIGSGANPPMSVLSDIGGTNHQIEGYLHLVGSYLLTT